MATISIGDAVSEGFSLIRKRPIAVLTWGTVRTAYTVGIGGLMAPLYISQFSQIIARARSGVTTPPPDMTSMMALQSANWLLSILGVLVSAILSCAVFRSVLKPQEGRFAYLRVGAPEVFLFLLTFGAVIVLAVAAFILAIPVIIFAVIAAAVHASAAAVLIGVVGGIAIAAFFVWGFCRLSLAGPMMVEDGKFHLMDAWALTRGQAFNLFLIGLSLFVILILIELVLGAFAVGLGMAFLGQVAGGLGAIPGFFTRPPADILSSLAPALALLAVLSIPVFGCMWAIIGAPWAKAYRDLAQPDTAATFS